MQRKTALFSAALLSLGLAAAQAQAQQDTTANSADQSQATAPAQDFSDAQLQQFADASKEIAVISQEYTKQLQSAEGDEAQQAVRKEANDEMVQAVQDSGLEVNTFNAIGQAIQQDPELMQRVQEMAKAGGAGADQAS
ncbi:DUF4168 domain-containing protein [Halomonas saccharevitans]|uniref:DUF4168 domain-containing protein n=1 Tax=Halomonas saccharevitans TaxID=416872 RepID=A0A1I7C4H8_9GAMM|nr:DUF4168 domain-containing protein [Halomonas saccharevitans]MDT8880276.1 DUF4168 domain-containing protein [Halomonas saccharevitans]SFT94329.1 protein of unknown function [Halomonas saccharevitans]